MNRQECIKALNEYQVLFPNEYKSMDREYLQRVVDSWVKRYIEVRYEDFIDALYWFDAETDYKRAPSTKEIKAYAKRAMEKRQEKQEHRTKRIVTPEEDCFNEFKELMAKGPKMTPEDVERCKKLQKYEELFEGEGWEERYIAHFGKPREEFERYG